VVLFRYGMHFGRYSQVDDGREVFDRLSEAVQVAEASGFDAISVPDHVLQNEMAGGRQCPMFEAYTVLGALAMRTTKVRLLALVSPVTLRNPAFLAKAVTTVDVISGGRAVLGIGAGWDRAEHEAYGYDFPSVGERMDRLDEAVTICKRLFCERQASFMGAHYTVRDAWNSPRPIAGAIPILLGGSGERRMLELVARHADAWNVVDRFDGDAGAVRHKFDILKRHCDSVGRDPSEISKTVFVTIPDDDRATFSGWLRILAKEGTDGVVVIGIYDAKRIEALGRTLTDVFS